MRKPRSEYPSEQADKFLLRFPDGMRDRLKAEAEANKRSINAEIVTRLQDSIEGPKVERKGSLPPAQALAILITEAMALAQECGINMKIVVGDISGSDVRTDGINAKSVTANQTGQTIGKVGVRAMDLRTEAEVQSEGNPSMKHKPAT